MSKMKLKYLSEKNFNEGLIRRLLINVRVYRSRCVAVALLSFKVDHRVGNHHVGPIGFGWPRKRIRKAFFTAISSLRRTITPDGDRRCTPFLYPNNLQSTAWHRTLLRNIVISPRNSPGFFRHRISGTMGPADARGCARAFTWIRITWRLSGEGERERGRERIVAGGGSDVRWLIGSNIMSADNDRHGTRPGANGKRWVRSIGAHGKRMHTVPILPSLVCARTHTPICVASPMHRGFTHTRTHSSVRKTWTTRAASRARVDIFFFSYESSACRRGSESLQASLLGFFKPWSVAPRVN